MPERPLLHGQRRHVADAIEELEAGFVAQWPSGRRPHKHDDGWMHFAQALDHLRDIEREEAS